MSNLKEKSKMSKKTYCPLHVHSFYSLLDGLSSPKALVKRCVELGLPGCAITDHGSISAMKSFYDACRKAKIKPVIGCEIYICLQDATIKNNDNNKRHHLIVLAKNDQGIKDLMSLVSESNKPEHFYRKPRISMEGLAPFASKGNLILLSACIGGELPSSLFTDFKAACSLSEHGGETNLLQVRACLKPDWKEVGKEIIKRFVTIAGEGNFYLELQDEGMSVQTVVTECLRILGEETGIPTVATIDAHYASKKDAEDQRLLLYAQLHTTKEDQARKQQQGIDIMDFFVSDEYFIPSYEEMRKRFTEEELQASVDIVDTINYSELGHDPYLPIFTNKESEKLGLNSNDYLKHLCIEGAKVKLSHLDGAQKKVYWDRLQRELIVIAEAKLADYFLIV